jgi:hypothetical protein
MAEAASGLEDVLDEPEVTFSAWAGLGAATGTCENNWTWSRGSCEFTAVGVPSVAKEVCEATASRRLLAPDGADGGYQDSGPYSRRG